VTGTSEITSDSEAPGENEPKREAKPIVVVALALIGTAVIVTFILLTVKKKNCPCNNKQSQ
jgi:hypothetical protein